MSVENPTFEVVFGPTRQAVKDHLPWEKIVDFGKHASERWNELEQSKRLETKGKMLPGLKLDC